VNFEWFTNLVRIANETIYIYILVMVFVNDCDWELDTTLEKKDGVVFHDDCVVYYMIMQFMLLRDS
jgi:hypothetical protein